MMRIEPRTLVLDATTLQTEPLTYKTLLVISVFICQPNLNLVLFSSGLLNRYGDQMPSCFTDPSRVPLLLTYMSVQGASSRSEMQSGKERQL